jgi:RNA polymerase sigma-70 factor (ECF subfamily)
MADQNTDLGGPQKEFPRTTANFLKHLRNPAAQGRQAVMEMLAERYWKPVYHFLRVSYGKGNEDAKDLTQAFFAWLLERDLLLRYDPARSSFRTFLKGVLRNFAGNEHQALQRLKRGGGLKVIPLDLAAADLERTGAESDPDRLFDTVFLKDAVDRAVDRVRARYQAGRRIVSFLAFQEFHLSKSGEPPTYAELAKRLGVKESDVRNYLHEVREAVRDEVKAEFASDGGELPGEVARLFGE